MPRNKGKSHTSADHAFDSIDSQALKKVSRSERPQAKGVHRTPATLDKSVTATIKSTPASQATSQAADPLVHIHQYAERLQHAINTDQLAVAPNQKSTTEKKKHRQEMETLLKNPGPKPQEKLSKKNKNKGKAEPSTTKSSDTMERKKEDTNQITPTEQQQPRQLQQQQQQQQQQKHQMPMAVQDQTEILQSHLDITLPREARPHELPKLKDRLDARDEANPAEEQAAGQRVKIPQHEQDKGYVGFVPALQGEQKEQRHEDQQQRKSDQGFPYEKIGGNQHSRMKAPLPNENESDTFSSTSSQPLTLEAIGRDENIRSDDQQSSPDAGKQGLDKEKLPQSQQISGSSPTDNLQQSVPHTSEEVEPLLNKSKKTYYSDLNKENQQAVESQSYSLSVDAGASDSNVGGGVSKRKEDENKESMRSQSQPQVEQEKDTSLSKFSVMDKRKQEEEMLPSIQTSDSDQQASRISGSHLPEKKQDSTSISEAAKPSTQEPQEPSMKQMDQLALYTQGTTLSQLQQHQGLSDQAQTDQLSSLKKDEQFKSDQLGQVAGSDLPQKQGDQPQIKPSDQTPQVLYGKMADLSLQGEDESRLGMQRPSQQSYSEKHQA